MPCDEVWTQNAGTANDTRLPAARRIAAHRRKLVGRARGRREPDEEKERKRPRTSVHPASISSASGSLGSYDRQVAPTAPCAAMPELQKADEGAHSASRASLQRSGLPLRGMRSKGAAFCATAGLIPWGAPNIAGELLSVARGSLCRSFWIHWTVRPAHFGPAHLDQAVLLIIIINS